MNTRITGTGYSLPAFRADNDYLATLVETSDEWITERTGIRARHLAGEETTVSMAAAAAEKALKRAGADPSEVELLIVATISGDTVTPSTACRVQALIGADKAVAFDINAACSGFLYALHMADACVKSGMYKNALLIGAETLSKLVDWNDRGTCILFGDGAGAAFVEATEEAGILAHEVGSDGSRWEVLSCEGRPNGNPVCKAEGQEGFLQMNGQEVFKFAVKKVPETINTLLKKENTDAEDIKYFILHQANVRIIESVAKRLGIDMNRFPVNLSKYGNTSSASIPILLDELNRENKLQNEDLLVFAGFGAGLNWGSILVKWNCHKS